MISTELWRDLIGLHHKGKCFHRTPLAHKEHTSFTIASLILIASVISILLTIGGIEINTGHITPTTDGVYQGQSKLSKFLPSQC